MSSDSSLSTRYLQRARMAADGSSSGPLSPELQRDLGQRLARLAASYSGAYLAAYGSDLLRMLGAGQHRHPMGPDLAAAASIVAGVVVFFVARRGKLPAAALANLTLAFQVLGALGIMAGSWGWEQHFDLFQRHVWEAVGAPAVTFPGGFVQRLTEARLRVIYIHGVLWVGVWVLLVSMVVPMSARRSLLAVTLTAANVPGVLLLSAAAHGVPASVAPWMDDLLVDTTLPTVICAGLAFFASRSAYRVTRDLSRAQQLGSYQLDERIGVGGMGEVWRARHRLLARPAAIKLIRPDVLSSPGGAAAREILRRFEREAQTTAGLHSPHTVELYDFGIEPDGTFYYVMELLDGYDLKTLVERFGPLPAPRAIHLLRQACHSLEDAHRAGLVHRDVKPANIFACRRGLDLDFVKVLDFGLVKSIAVGHETIDVSAAGVARGTPAFMPPEAVTGSAPVDARADLYALGCVAYWLLTGALVFEGPTPLAVLLKHVHEPPVPPSTRLGGPVASPLEQLVLECLSKDPAQRPPTAAALAERLAGCATSAGVWAPEQAEAWWIEHAPS